MKIVILGAAGQLGRHLCSSLPGDVVGLTRADADITSLPQLRAAFERHRPTVIVNAAGFTHVDRAESEADVALAVNAHAVRDLAALCRESACTLIHVSTNYVYGADDDRKMPYRESDAAAPINRYGYSKLLGETHVRAECPHHFILRTCGLYGVFTSGSRRVNFVETMLRQAQAGAPLRVVCDQVCTPTSVADFARGVGELLHSRAYGTYHVTNTGECTWHEFAQAIFALTERSTSIEPIRSDQLTAPARRPRYSVLCNRRWQESGFTPLWHWRDALAEYLANRVA